MLQATSACSEAVERYNRLRAVPLPGSPPASSFGFAQVLVATALLADVYTTSICQACAPTPMPCDPAIRRLLVERVAAFLRASPAAADAAFGPDLVYLAVALEGEKNAAVLLGLLDLVALLGRAGNVARVRLAVMALVHDEGASSAVRVAARSAATAIGAIRPPTLPPTTPPPPTTSSASLGAFALVALPLAALAVLVIRARR